MKNLNIAVAGVGFWGRNQLRILKKIPKVTVTGICDIDKVKVSAISDEFDVPGYTDFSKLLSQEQVDALTICTPTITHYQIALEALDQSKHVLIEKPMTNTVTEAHHLLQKAEQKNSYISVGFIERFNPAVKYVKKIIAHGDVGRIILVLARRVTRWPSRIGDIGVTKDSAIHDIDVMRYLLECEITSVYSQMGSLQHKFEDYSEICMKFNTGAIGFIDANWITPKKIRQLTITGSEATILVDYLTQSVTFSCILDFKAASQISKALRPSNPLG